MKSIKSQIMTAAWGYARMQAERLGGEAYEYMSWALKHSWAQFRRFQGHIRKPVVARKVRISWTTFFCLLLIGLNGWITLLVALTNRQDILSNGVDLFSGGLVFACLGYLIALAIKTITISHRLIYVEVLKR